MVGAATQAMNEMIDVVVVQVEHQKIDVGVSRNERA